MEQSVRLSGILLAAAFGIGAAQAQQSGPATLPGEQPQAKLAPPAAATAGVEKAVVAQAAPVLGIKPIDPAAQAKQADSVPVVVQQQPPVQPPQQPQPQPTQQPPANQSPFGSPFGAPGATMGLASEFGMARSMIGDFGGFCSHQLIYMPQTLTKTTTLTFLEKPNGPTGRTITKTTTNTILVPVEVCNPVVARAGSGFEISENSSPLPVDRVYFTYNYFNDLGGAGGFTPGASATTTMTTPTVRLTNTISLPNTSVSAAQTDLHREVFGIEKTFLDGDASVEFRLPMFERGSGDSDFGADGLGDATFVLKYALINDRTTGNVLSAGLGVTAPTSHGIDTFDGRIHDWLLQPFFGYLVNFGPLYVHGFTAMVVPTDSQDVTVFFEDLGIGYRLFEAPDAGTLLTSITPTLEVHAAIPLNHRSGDDLIEVSDIVSFTGGVHFGIGPRSILTLGVNAPVTGPTPYHVEAMVQYNLRF
jgi:hypothetical protein